jgi:hypothetical protein
MQRQRDQDEKSHLPALFPGLEHWILNDVFSRVDEEGRATRGNQS